ncbi:hypothetical protein [Nostoc sp. CHAB 5836]|nr:hypothetical protein [Nostoc sp. CHAB 5836]
MKASPNLLSGIGQQKWTLEGESDRKVAMPVVNAPGSQGKIS